MRIVYVSLVPRYNFRGKDFGFGELVPGLAEDDRQRPLAAVRNGRLMPVLFDTLSQSVQREYEGAITAPSESDSGDDTEPESEPEPKSKPAPKKAPASKSGA